MLQGLVGRLDDVLRTAGLQWRLRPSDRTLLLAAIGLWVKEAEDTDSFSWIEAGQLGRALAEEIGQPQPRSSVIADSLLRLSLASVRPVEPDGEHPGASYVVDRYLEMAGQRTVNGRPAAWRIRPGGWLRGQLRQALADHTDRMQSA